MRVIATRDSVAMGDDYYAPHEQSFSFADETPIIEVVAAIASSGYLASIASGKATWSVVSGFPIAVVAQQWTEPRPVPWRPVGAAGLDVRNGAVYLHFNYHTQIDPEVVFETLRRLKLRASD